MMEEESEGESGWNGAGGRRGGEGGPTFGLGFLFGLQREDDHQSPHDALQTSAAIWKCSSARRSASAQAALAEAKRKEKKADVKKGKERRFSQLPVCPGAGGGSPRSGGVGNSSGACSDAPSPSRWSRLLRRLSAPPPLTQLL